MTGQRGPVAAVREVAEAAVAAIEAEATLVRSEVNAQVSRLAIACGVAFAASAFATATIVVSAQLAAERIANATGDPLIAALSVIGVCLAITVGLAGLSIMLFRRARQETENVIRNLGQGPAVLPEDDGQ